MRTPTRTIAVSAAALAAALVLGGCAPTVTANPPAATDAPAPTAPTSPPPSKDAPAAGSESGADAWAGSTPRDADLRSMNFATGWRDAIATASEAFSGEPVSVSLEWERSVWAYTVKLLSADEVYLMTVNADTGAVLGDWTKPRGGGGKAGTPSGVFPADGVIEPAAAIAAALDAAPGTFAEWELESDDGVLAFEVEIDQGHDDVEVRIDAASGAVLKIDS